jgi:hypothetical protein
MDGPYHEFGKDFSRAWAHEFGKGLAYHDLGRLVPAVLVNFNEPAIARISPKRFLLVLGFVFFE